MNTIFVLAIAGGGIYAVRLPFGNVADETKIKNDARKWSNENETEKKPTGIHLLQSI